MPNLLLLQNSANLDHSVSRRITNVFLATYLENHPGTVVSTRDLVTDPLPHLPTTLFAAQVTGDVGSPQSEAVALSEILIKEVEVADVIVIGSPLYNFTIPSTFKAWLDHIIRARRTFQYVDGRPQGLLPEGKRVIVFLASGGTYTEPPNDALDFFEPYVRFIFSFIGITDVTVVRSELQAVPSIGQANTDAALLRAIELAA